MSRNRDRLEQSNLSSQYVSELTRKLHTTVDETPRSIFRSTLRKMVHFEYQNEFSQAVLDLLVFYPLEHCSRPYEWIREFADFEHSKEHPLFRKYIEQQMRKDGIPSTEYRFNIKRYMAKADPEEVRAYCHGMTTEAQSFFATHVEEITRKQQIVRISDENNEKFETFLNRMASSDGEVIEDTYRFKQYQKEGGKRPVKSQLDITKLGKRTVVEVLSKKLTNTITNEKFTFFENRVENIDERISVQEIKDNAVYSMAMKRFSADKHFPVLFYAPPNSGKTTFNMRHRWCLDTDYIHAWSLLPSKGCYITNMANLVSKAMFSIALIPSRKVFRERCLSRGLSYVERWYDDMIIGTQDANIKILSDKYLDQLGCIADWDTG